MLHFVNFLLDIFQSMGYLGVFFLMVIESSFIPFPSEIVIPPAAYLASQGEMNFWAVIVFGILGSLVGAIINYLIAMWLGRAVIYSLTEKKFSKLILIDSAKVKKAEDLFLKYGSMSTFFGRLIPVVRQLISLPAGFARMNFFKFIFFTAIGSGVWVIILALLGYYFGENKELLKNNYKIISISIAFLALLSIIIFIKIKNKKTNRS